MSAFDQRWQSVQNQTNIYSGADKPGSDAPPASDSGEMDVAWIVVRVVIVVGVIAAIAAVVLLFLLLLNLLGAMFFWHRVFFEQLVFWLAFAQLGSSYFAVLYLRYCRVRGFGKGFVVVVMTGVLSASGFLSLNLLDHPFYGGDYLDLIDRFDDADIWAVMQDPGIGGSLVGLFQLIGVVWCVAAGVLAVSVAALIMSIVKMQTSRGSSLVAEAARALVPKGRVWNAVAVLSLWSCLALAFSSGATYSWLGWLGAAVMACSGVVVSVVIWANGIRGIQWGSGGAEE